MPLEELLDDPTMLGEDPSAADNSDAYDSSGPLSQVMKQRAKDYYVNPETVKAKRDALLKAYSKLIEIKQNNINPYSATPGIGGSSALATSGDPSMAMFGKIFLGNDQNKQKALEYGNNKNNDAAMLQLKMDAQNLGLSEGDRNQEFKYLQAAGASDYKNDMLRLMAGRVDAKNKQLVKDQSGNPIGYFNKTTGAMEPLGGGDASGAGGDPLPPVQIPGIAPDSPAHAGITSIIDNAGLDINNIHNRTRPELAEAVKDSAGAKALLDGANSASAIAARAKEAIEGGYPGGILGGIESMGNAMLPESMQFDGIKNRDLLNKYSGQISSALATQMHGARIGVGMEKFLKNTTFNPDISKDANLDIVNNLQELPYVAQRNMELESLTNSLPSAHKNAVYSEFLNDNPPFIENDKKKTVLNPVYKDKDMIKKWFTKKGGGTVKETIVGGKPDDIDDKVWSHMTDEEKSLWATPTTTPGAQ